MRSTDPKTIAVLALAVLLLAGGLAIVYFRLPQTDYSLLNDSNVAPIPVPSHLSRPQLATARIAAGQVQLAAIPGAAPIPGTPTPNVAPSPRAPQTQGPAASRFTLSAHDLDIALHPSLKYKPSLASGADQVALASFGPSPATPGGAPAPIDSIQSEGRLIDANLKMEEDRRFVMSMCEDQQRCLWVGTEGGGVQRFDASAPELHQWTQFTTKDGLGDDNGYALACDRLGRIWAGNLSHGISIYNGNPQGHWQSY